MDEKAPLPSSPSAHPHPRPSPLPAFSTALKRITLSPTTLLLLPILLLASRLPQTALYIYRTRTAYYTHAPSFHSIATLASPNPDTSFLLNDAAAARAAGSIASDVLTVLLAGAHWGINMLVVVYDIDVREPFPETWRWLVFGSLGWSAVLDGWAGWGAVRAMGVEGCVVAWRKRKGGWVYECGVEAAVCGLPGVWPEQIDGERLEGACWEAVCDFTD
ncbi:hypothetical protein EJ04DRAFT_521221 [Polyplosphaeria fusca]|uniref:Uncharacterized protein n=1 Tax=Polyplosphaeria fusca TaxID=682080 RepID=A0A9P4R6S8_9PLEO|nr:hypothetical protein EJ04DRAFT_521221 [Polyplosphaeria fusca]